MYKPVDFNREEYLQYEAEFNDPSQPIDGDNELSEFSWDIEAIAVELAYTRFTLAKAEKKLEER